MRKHILTYLAAVMTAAMIIILAMCYEISTVNRKNSAVLVAGNRIDQLSRTLKSNETELQSLWDSLSEDYLTRARAFAYIIDQDPSVLESQAELEKIKNLLNVDELHVIDEKGILKYGTIPKYFGMDFASTDQTKEFLDILKDRDKSLVQDIRPNGAEQKLFQYVGIARTDKPGIVQIGLKPSRYMEAKRRNELAYLFARLPVDAGGFMAAADAETGKALAYTNRAYLDSSMAAVFTEEERERMTDGELHTLVKGSVCYVAKQYDTLILCVGQTVRNIFRLRDQQLMLVFVCLALICLIVIFVLDRILQKRIIKGIYEIMDSLQKITKGDLDTVVDVKGTKEFEGLSLEINRMVQSILDTTVKLSRIMDMVDAPIGAFEWKAGMKRVLVTSRTGALLNLDGQGEKELFGDKDKFLGYLEKLLKTRNEAGVCRLEGDSKRWIRLLEVKEEQGVFGIVQDVTGEMEEKLKIMEERDYDALTGVFSRRRFEEEAGRILSEEAAGGFAVIMFDLDAFKQINDSFGHGFGDSYLKHAAFIFLKWIGEKGIVGRRSGDEFYVLLKGIGNRKEAAEKLERLYELLELYPVSFPEGKKGAIRVSGGFVLTEENSVSFDRLLEMADTALYQAKKTNRGYFCEFGSAESLPVRRTAGWKDKG